MHSDVDRDTRVEHDTGVGLSEGGLGGVGGEADGGGVTCRIGARVPAPHPTPPPEAVPPRTAVWLPS